MTRFESDYFQKFKFTPSQITRYLDGALRDLEIAQKDKFSEVRFTYSYQALIKAGITLIAKTGRVRVKSATGHHVKIMEKMSEILRNPDIMTIGNAMRMKRNYDLYGGGESISEKEADDYLKFVEQVFQMVQKELH